MQREVQCVMQIVIEVRAGTDDEVHQAAIHHLHYASADAGGRHGARDRQTDSRVFVGREHFVRENAARFGQTRGVERLEPLIDKVPNFLAALWTIKRDGLAGKCALESRAAWMTVRHRM